MTRRIAQHALVVVAFVLAGCAVGSTDELALPDIELDRLGGGTYDLTNDDGPRALNLWATWCAPCRAELPAFDAVATQLRADGAGVDVIGVNVGDSGDDAAELVDELSLSFEQILDPSAQVQRSLKITGLPATIFVDASGEVLDVHNGELTETELVDLLDEFFDLDLGA